MVHQLAAVDKRAKIKKNVIVEPFTTIAGDVEIGEGTWIGSNVTIMDGARIGRNCRIFPGTVISAVPQDLKFDGEDTQVIIGDGTTLRECVTVNRGTKALGFTKIGKDCLIMATSHIAHDRFLLIFSSNYYTKLLKKYPVLILGIKSMIGGLWMKNSEPEIEKTSDT